MTPKHPENQAPLDVWRARVASTRSQAERVALLIDMVQAHQCVGSYMEANLNGRCAGLLKAARDPLRAVSVLHESMANTNRRGDPVAYAMGMLKNQRARATGNGHGGETMSAAQLIAMRKETA